MTTESILLLVMTVINAAYVVGQWKAKRERGESSAVQKCEELGRHVERLRAESERVERATRDAFDQKEKEYRSEFASRAIVNIITRESRDDRKQIHIELGNLWKEVRRIATLKRNETDNG